MHVTKDTSDCARVRLVKTLSPARKNRDYRIWRILARISLLHACVVILLLTMLFGSACHLIFPFDVPAADPSYECTMKQIGCVLKQKKANVTVIKPAGLICQPKAYLAPGDPVYCGINLSKLTNSGSCNTFKTSTVVKLPFSARSDTSSDYLKIRVLEDVEGFYLAYDSRVTTKPKWLEDLFDKSTCASDFVTITNPKMSSPPSPACNQPLKMQVYKWKTSPLKKDTVITVPGNAHGYQNVPGNLPSACLRMYIPFIKPERKLSDLNCSKPYQTKTFANNYCVTVDEEGKDDATIWKDRYAKAVELIKKSCADDLAAKQLENWKCDEPTADCNHVDGYCSRPQIDDQDIGKRTFAHTISSMVEFVPSLSTATFTLDGDSDTSQINGAIDFEYAFNQQLCDCMDKMLIDDLRLKIGNLSVKEQNFTNMYISLNKRATASCDNIATQIGRKPCQFYTIPAGELSFNFNAKHNGARRLIVVDN
ncbi:MAG: hypothetical protein JSU70_05975, partial [Phycisphaerales bacterium]